MSREEVLYLIPYFVSLALSIGVLVYTWSSKSAPGAIAVAWYVLGQVLWPDGFIFELVRAAISGKVFWDQFQWLAGFVVVVALPVFMVEYTEYKLDRANIFFWLSLIFPSILTILLLVDTYQWIYINP